MVVDNSGQLLKLPDFMLAGAAKCGTTSIYQYLQHHPRIYIPEIKEPFYFSFDDQEPTYTSKRFKSKVVWQQDEYLKLYKHLEEHIKLGDASTSYLYTAATTIKHMQRVYGERSRDVRIMLILRNPVDRAFSHYTHLVRNGLEPLSFEKALDEAVIEERKMAMWGYDYINYGHYYESIKLFKNHFHNIRIYLFEDLAQPQMLINDLCDFLEVNRILIPSGNIKANASGIPKNASAVKLLRSPALANALKKIIPARFKENARRVKERIMVGLLERPAMSPDLRHEIWKNYESELDALEDLIERDLSKWKRDAR
ncbi:MAG: sulfotransferase family protein [Flavobacteriales bacterium]